MKSLLPWSVITCLAVIFLILVSMWAWPKYNVYACRLQGQSLLAHAQSAKEVAVAEAKAKLESSTLLAQAEIERAKGVAQANKIIGESLRENESYLRDYRSRRSRGGQDCGLRAHRSQSSYFGGKQINPSNPKVTPPLTTHHL